MFRLAETVISDKNSGYQFWGFHSGTAEDVGVSRQMPSRSRYPITN